jgi:hypothetical protein
VRASARATAWPGRSRRAYAHGTIAMMPLDDSDAGGVARVGASMRGRVAGSEIGGTWVMAATLRVFYMAAWM